MRALDVLGKPSDSVGFLASGSPAMSAGLLSRVESPSASANENAPCLKEQHVRVRLFAF
ncbi:MAG: hypothetical protein IPI48_14670 [bacterium]|nr:hypothetical protein [bacterium]